MSEHWNKQSSRILDGGKVRGELGSETGIHFQVLQPCQAASLEAASSGPLQEAQEEAQVLQDTGCCGDEAPLSRGVHMLLETVGNKCQILGKPRYQVPGDWCCLPRFRV